MYRQLTAVADPEKLAAAMEHQNVDMDIRAERVTVSQFLAMAEEIFSSVTEKR
ncbi:MAG: hypothetical protein IKB22_08540 [Lentisphaeria bacterium]|nr:hypothetical protein [Lentisphaeria bacterium]